MAEEVRDRAVEKLKAAHPEYDYLYAPSYYLGSDTVPGSVAFDSRAVNLTLRGLGSSWPHGASVTCWSSTTTAGPATR